MIPILYEGTEQNFTSNGLGRLADAISCNAVEERNGIFELEMTYPMSGIHFDDIKESRIIYALTEEGGNPQAFMIYDVSKPLNGIVTVKANHISYVLNGIPVFPFEAISLADAMSQIPGHAVEETPFTYSTDIASSVRFSFSEPRSIRSLLGGEQGSLLDTYGGYDYKFDNFHVSLLADRGNDNGIVLRYGKNLSDLVNDVSSTNVYTGIVPFWTDGTTSVYLTEKVVYSEHASDYPYKIIKTVDFSQEFESAPTEEQLRSRAESYIRNNQGWKLKNTIKVSFVALWQTEEYKDIAALERVRMCDTVRVSYKKMGIEVQTRVIKTNYNVLKERYDSIELGDATYNLSQAIQESIVSPEMVKNESYVKSAVTRATKLIQGGLGGHVVFNTNANGEPQEILIMDTDSIETAVNVIRMNLNGIGFSHNGYNGPFETAWTIDGSFVADYITAGTFNGALIRAESIDVDALNIVAKNDLGGLMNYVPYDWNTNVNRWEYNARQPYTGRGYIEGKLTPYFGMNAQNIHSYMPSYQTQFTSSYFGNVKLHFEILINFYGSGEAVIEDQQLAYLWYADRGGSYHEQEICRISGTYQRQSVERDASKCAKISADIELQAYADTTNGTPKIGLRFIAGEDAEVFSLVCYSYKGDYIQNTLQFNANGLESVVQSGNIISTINQSAEAVTISASKINLSGDLSLRGDFKSYDANDEDIYAYLNSAALSFFNENGNVFTISSKALYGQYAGIFFGDPEDFGRYSMMNQEQVRSPIIYGRNDGSHADKASDPYYTGVFEHSLYADTINCDHINTRADTAYYNYIRGATQFTDTVYDASGGSVFVSDARKKKNIKDLAIDKVRSFIMGLKPREYKFKKGISKSNRKHHGFIAQEVKDVMNEDWGLYVEEPKEDFIGLRYDELIADIVLLLQDHEREIQSLKEQLKERSRK